MKTTNWQTKALTLFIAAVALWLATACGNADSTIEVQPAPATTATPTQAATQAPVVELTETPIAESPTQQSGCVHESHQLTSRMNTSEEEYQRHRNQRGISTGVISKY